MLVCVGDVYVHIYIRTCIYVTTHVHIYIYIYITTCTDIHTYTHIYTHLYIHICIYTYNVSGSVCLMYRSYQAVYVSDSVYYTHTHTYNIRITYTT